MNDTTISLTTLHTTTRNCTEAYSYFQCCQYNLTRIVAIFILTFSLVPQVFRLFKYRSSYIAGISYIWILIRMLASIFLMSAVAFQWSASFLWISAMLLGVIYCQVIIYSNNLHRQQKLIFVGISLFIWIIGAVISVFLIKNEEKLITFSYLFSAVQMLPQVR
jgi:ABC-type Fe3+-siderophore transport system permease subunit